MRLHLLVALFFPLCAIDRCIRCLSFKNKRRKEAVTADDNLLLCTQNKIYSDIKCVLLRRQFMKLNAVGAWLSCHRFNWNVLVCCVVVKGIHSFRTIWVDIFISAQCFLNCEWLRCSPPLLFFPSSSFSTILLLFHTQTFHERSPNAMNRYELFCTHGLKHKINQRNLFYVSKQQVLLRLQLDTRLQFNKIKRVHTHSTSTLTDLKMRWNQTKLDFHLARTQITHFILSVW